jgi:hypothetical protein
LLRKEKEYAIFLAAQTPKNNARVKNNYNEKTPIPKQVFFFFFKGTMLTSAERRC